ncbi:SRPBCC domain-containing protein [Sphingomonas sp. AOB5]|uniref:SRPBCC family protein n=1 Tax=Sphingomonas sp. AOB5 TaxID=3034017 RepID=UPI0023F63D95|nr:SRPBCC domain-containing protein [Sphingomonas sp. AOB5]MDF7773681.1 SRPBCC domain-containing protein [Sphingomonas sp. AOB5]
MPVAPRLTLLLRLKASPETVFALWTKADHVRQWWGGTKGRAMMAQLDPRPGGRFWVPVRPAEGPGYDTYGIFSDVIRGEALIIDWETDNARPSRLVIQLLKLGDWTEITITHRNFPSEAARDLQLARWQDSLVALETYAATIGPDDED